MILATDFINSIVIPARERKKTRRADFKGLFSRKDLPRRRFCGSFVDDDVGVVVVVVDVAAVFSN